MSATARKLDFDDVPELPAAEPESIIVVRRAPRTAPTARRHAAPARPRLLPAAGPRRRARLGLFAIVCLAIATAGLVSMLIVNTMLASGAFTVSELQAEKALLFEQEQQLTEELAIASSPQKLEERARELGMVPQDAAAFLDLETGAIVGNDVPQPAPIVVDPSTGPYLDGYLIDPSTGEIYIDPYTGLPVSQDGQPIGFDGTSVDGIVGEDPVFDSESGTWVDPVTGQPVGDPASGEADVDAPVGEDLPGTP